MLTCAAAGCANQIKRGRFCASHKPKKPKVVQLGMFEFNENVANEILGAAYERGLDDYDASAFGAVTGDAIVIINPRGKFYRWLKTQGLIEKSGEFWTIDTSLFPKENPLGRLNAIKAFSTELFLHGIRTTLQITEDTK